MNKTILTIDDDINLHKMLEMVLSNQNYNAVSALSGSEGLRMAKEIKPDLILLDVNMPDISGLDVCRQLKDSSQTKKIPVIMLTGKEEYELNSFDFGVDDYITKPYNSSVLLARIKAVLARTNYKKELAEIFKIGLAKIAASVVATVALIGIVYGLSFRFVINTANLGRYAETQLGEVYSRVNLLFTVEAGIFLVILCIAVCGFAIGIRKRTKRLENLFSELIKNQ